jgi:hypothetical protein
MPEKNPVEWIGQAHNACIHYVFDRINPSKPVELKKIAGLIEDYFAASGFPVEKNSLPRTEAALKKVVAPLKRAAMSRALFAAVTKLDALTLSATSRTAYQNGVRKLENAAQRVLNVDDLRTFQAMSAVARHSADLWMQGGSYPITGGGGTVPAGMAPGRVIVADYRTLSLRPPYTHVYASVLSKIEASRPIARHPDTTPFHILKSALDAVLDGSVTKLPGWPKD